MIALIRVLAIDRTYINILKSTLQSIHLILYSVFEWNLLC